MIDIIDVEKHFGTRTIFDKVSLHVGPRSRIALIGPNGSGKTTLIRLILEEERPDQGSVAKASHLTIGYLPQEVGIPEDETVLASVLRLTGRREELLATKQELEERFSRQGDYPGHEEDLERYGHILTELEHMDEYRLEALAKEVLTGMGFKPADLGRRLAEFSGGWRMRAVLSRILLLSPDLLLLDEPTNHLDLESLLWLEEYLLDYKGALLLVSHDRAFLNRMVGEVVEIEQRELFSYKGSLDEYEFQKEKHIELLRARYKVQQNKIAQIEKFTERFRYKATKARQVQSRLKQLEKMERIELPGEHTKTIHFGFPPSSRGGKQTVTLEEVNFAYGAKKIFQGLDWVIGRDSRLAIVGVNGAGKTTLLKLLSGVVGPTQGSIRFGHNVEIGYYAQHTVDSLDLQKTIYEELHATTSAKTPLELRSLAGAFLFSGDDIDKPCRVLSGGEKARVALAKLLLKPHNFLLLDEPTNHLDAQSRQVLLEALLAYEGTLCLVSHDREFMRPLIDTVLEIVPVEEYSEVRKLVENYDDYLARKMREAASLVHHTEMSVESASGQVVVMDRSARKMAKEEELSPEQAQLEKEKVEQRKELKKKLVVLEQEIAGLEKRKQEIHAILEVQGTYENRNKLVDVFKELHQIDKALAAKMAQWEQMSEQLKK